MADSPSAATSIVVPAVVTTPKTTTPIVKPSEVVKKSEEQELHEKISNTVREHGGLESNIPINHPYWAWLNSFRSLVSRNK